MECQDCGKTFKSKQNLQYHLIKKIKCNRIIQCDNCKKEFNTTQKLNRHLNNKKPCVKLNLEADNKILKLEKEVLELTLTNNKQKLINSNKQPSIKQSNITKPIINNTTYEHNNITLQKLDITYNTLLSIDITQIILKYNRLLNITELLHVIDYKLNKEYFRKFGNIIKSDKWIYVNQDLIYWIGYDEFTLTKEIILNLLQNNHIINEDYKILNNDDLQIFIEEDIDPMQNNYNIIISCDCFKELCLEINTDNSKEVKKSFIDIEKILKFHLKYVSEYNKYELDKSKLIKNMYINKHNLIVNSKLYLITTIAKAKENIFKFGSTINEKSRKSSYNTGNLKAEKFIYVAIYNCYDAISLERRIAKLLINFKIPNENELYQLHFTALDKIIKDCCNNDNASLNRINKFLTYEYDNYLDLEPITFIHIIEEI